MGDLLEPGQIFGGRYRIQRLIARGGMGAVYAGEQIATELPVAVKVLYPHILRSTDSIEKFQLEAKVAGRVNSEHIVRVLDAGYDRTSRLPFLVMELLRGQELKSLVDKGGPLSLEAAVEYMRQVASGLDRAHRHVNRDGAAKAIIHRDLKPENLFLTRRENGEPVVKILDFGLAKVLGDSVHVSQDVKGTPLFMAYEQAAGLELSPETDIWSFGLTTFYLLTGRNYWKTASTPRSSMASLFAEILTLPLVSPTERIRELGSEPSWPPAFDAWFLRCLDRDPKMRFHGAAAAAAELSQALRTTGSAGTLSSAPGLARTVSGVDHLGATSPSNNGPQSSSGSRTLPSGTRITDEVPSSDVNLPMRWGSQRPKSRRASYPWAILGALAFGGVFWLGFSVLRVRNNAPRAEQTSPSVAILPREDRPPAHPASRPSQEAEPPIASTPIIASAIPTGALPEKTTKEVEAPRSKTHGTAAARRTASPPSLPSDSTPEEEPPAAPSAPPPPELRDPYADRYR